MSQAYWEHEYDMYDSLAQRRYPHEPLIVALHMLFASLEQDALQYLEVLDVGCGNGRHLGLLHKMGCQYGLHGIDWSTEACKLSKDACPDAEVIHGNCIHLPYSSESFDLVIDVMTMQHLVYDDYYVALKEVFRILKPGGHFYTYRFSEGTGYSNALLRDGSASLFSQKQLERAFWEAKLGPIAWEIVRRQAILPYLLTPAVYHSVTARKEK